MKILRVVEYDRDGITRPPTDDREWEQVSCQLVMPDSSGFGKRWIRFAVLWRADAKPEEIESKDRRLHAKEASVL